jgi:hypothetical protein
MLGVPPLEPFHQLFFEFRIFEIGSQELFVEAGFKPQTS